MTSINYEYIDILYRSRVTLLDHLEDCGYDTTKYRKFSTKEIGEMLEATQSYVKVTAPPAFEINVERIRPSIHVLNGSLEEENEPKKCKVVYTINKIKQKILLFTNEFVNPEETDFDPKTTELIIITMEPVGPMFHAAAAKIWNNSQTRVRYFQAATLVNNALKHKFVPPHKKVTKENEEKLLKEWNTKKSQLPFIRFHEDMPARLIGLIPGDIVEIIRPSATAGETVIYRVCVP
jgi:DNA-directed RNA polymerase subunit H (RpoH/RPB5)